MPSGTQRHSRLGDREVSTILDDGGIPDRTISRGRVRPLARSLVRHDIPRIVGNFRRRFGNAPRLRRRSRTAEEVFY